MNEVELWKKLDRIGDALVKLAEVTTDLVTMHKNPPQLFRGFPPYVPPENVKAMEEKVFNNNAIPKEGIAALVEQDK